MSTATPQEASAQQEAKAEGGLHQRMLDALGERIASGLLPPHSRLTLDDLQQEFGVSRTVARDTMRVLESMNLVYSRRRVGIVVQEPERWNVFDPKLVRWRLASGRRDEQYASLLELRVAVEPIAAAGAAHRATPAQKAELAGLAAELRRLGEAGDLEAFLAADIAFHRLVLHSCGNEMFAALDNMVAEVLTSRTRQGLMPFHPRPEALDAHEAVASAVAGGNAAAAEESMHSVISEVRGAMGLG
ncbi:FCD domain-containing protein [Sinomonas sp. ASV486]|uniref:FadR/GntR family transcriptional regulator n=1 Tax=Sinomonas sp. ASV486 TaxID=3051170 RepID=UPI0027DE8D0C|nr:FCD domain-containing protein [Sinomonas sp. ASV486]MDQ4490078.1 FCD domain-containing protein [Sinomonas sp. ASV486]